MGVYTGTVPTILAGEIAPGDDFAELTALATALTGPWTVDTSYASTAWSASAGSVSIGDGTLSARYRHVGKTRDFSVVLVGGTTTLYGNNGAYWQFKIPGGGTAASAATGVVWGLDPGVNQYFLMWRIGATDDFMELYKPPSGRHQNNSPWTFGTSSRLEFSGTVETTQT